MLIGITYDLRSDYLAAGYGEEETAEFDRESTIKAIDAALRNMGHETVPIGNFMGLTPRLLAGERWDLVFNICEGLYGFGREALVPALLEAHRIPYVFSDPLVLGLTLHKGMSKHVVRDLDIPTPPFAVVKSMADVTKVTLAYPVFAKPVAEGTGKGVTTASKISPAEELLGVCAELLQPFPQPVLVEAFLPGREFTVGIVGNGPAARSIGVMEVVLLPNSEPEVYSYHNKEFCEELVEYRKVDDPEAKQAEATALAAWRGLDCRDGGRVDLRSEANGIPNFIEGNPLAGLHPEHSDLCIIAGKYGISYQELLGEIMAAAIV